MIAFSVLLLIVVIICIIILYDKYSPKIDIFKSKNRYVVLFWYNKWYWSGEYRRTYIKLFEV